ncbi:MAG TPA: ankyrin repeat domain-containing protein, partial [Candidatus Melainabacteria bacterium]|nr:ankyrin repeat domain-containing protein [Candidatus Melainabacteria bacterium]
FPERPTREDSQEILDEALCYACFNNRLEAARFLLERGANPNARPFYATALHFAVAKDNVELVDILMEAGADLFVEDDIHRSTPQGWAEWGCQNRMSDYLLSIMADSDLVHSVASGDSSKVQKLISQSSKRELMGEKGKQALLEAIESGNEEIEKLLRDGGARLCLSSAAAIGSIEDVEYLIGQGMSPNSTMTVSVPVPGSHAIEK